MTTYIPHLTLPQAVFDSPAFAVLLPVVSGAAIGYATRPKETQKMYMAMKQPPLRPPPYIFGPVWTLLYGLMGYASYRAVHYGTSPFSPVETIRLARQGATLYSIQLGLNLAWMPLFFGLKRPIEATLDIVALLGINAYLFKTWYPVDKVAGWCLAPYLVWLGFATYLSAGAGYLNNWDLSNKQVEKKDV
ncbi:TspO/MBR-related protein [Thozetella sp. PMI_491]|nr:TspO/MBR-related protein [Thozetella sp. PMI_491]